MPIERVRELLEREHVTYRTMKHAEAYTAQEEAAAAHVSGYEWAKTVAVYLDDDPALAVLPATHHVDPERLARAAGAERIRLAGEPELAELFPDCEVGAMPPFGALWDVPVYLDRALEGVERVAFHAGSHDEAVEMEYAEFARLLDAAVADFASAGVAGDEDRF